MKWIIPVLAASPTLVAGCSGGQASDEPISFQRGDDDAHSDFLEFSLDPETLEASALVRRDDGAVRHEFTVTADEASTLVEQVTALAAAECGVKVDSCTVEEPNTFFLGSEPIYGMCCETKPHDEYGGDFAEAVNTAFYTFTSHIVAGPSFDNPATFSTVSYFTGPGETEDQLRPVSTGSVTREADGTLLLKSRECPATAQDECDSQPADERVLTTAEQAELEQRLGELKDPVCIAGPFSANNGTGATTHSLRVDGVERGTCYGSFWLRPNLEEIEEFAEWLAAL